MTSRTGQALAAALLLMVAACGGQEKTVEQLASEAPSQTSAIGTAPATTTSTSTPGAIRSDGRYPSIDDLRAAVEQAGVNCSSWTPADPVQVSGARDQALCGTSPGSLLVTFSTGDLNPSKVLMALQARARKNLQDGGQGFVVVRGMEWAALTTRANAQQLQAVMGGELYDEKASTEATEPPAG